MSFSLARVDEPGVLVETAKWAEDEDALILRLYEADGGAGRASVSLGVPAARVDQVDLLERNPLHIEMIDTMHVQPDVRAHEVKTLRIELAR